MVIIQYHLSGSRRLMRRYATVGEGVSNHRYPFNYLLLPIKREEPVHNLGWELFKH